ncbi:Uncharacterised protein [Clostridioides difficile]|nr:Uncharacterised protein [Clostridioides difficile]
MQFFAFGCGEKTIVFPAFRDIIVLYITVDVGFVEGIRPATTPTGVAISIVFASLSSLIIPIVFVFFKVS